MLNCRGLKVICKFLFVGPLIAAFLVSCETTPYAPPPQPVYVEKINIVTTDYHGRPDIYADISGRLSSNAAQLVDVKQSRANGNLMLVQVNEQTPRGNLGTNKVPHPPFQTRIPLEVLGLEPGRVYIVDANGTKTHFQMPGGDEENLYTSSEMTSTTTGLELPRY
jgi:hypothetical protein